LREIIASGRAALLAAYLITAALFLAAWIASGPVVAQRQNSFDIYPHLVALREFTAGRTPYTEEVMRTIQQGYYGRLAHEGEDLHRISYPAYAYVLLSPLRPLEIPVAIRLWMALQLPAVFVALCLWSSIAGRLTTGMIIVNLALALTYRYSITIFLNGQFNALLLALYSAGIWLIVRRRDGAGGAVLALSTLQPTLMGPLAFLQTFNLGLKGRWRALLALTIVLLALTLCSMLIIGWWLPDWLRALGGYASYQRFMTWVPQRFGVVWGVIGLALISLPLLRRMGIANTYALSATGLLLLIPQTGVYTLITLLPMLILALQRAVYGSRSRQLAIYALSGGFIAASWGFLALSFESAKLESLLMPLFALGIFALAAPLTSRPAWSSPSASAHGETPPAQP
jgi:hypothetical protein